MDGQLTVNLGIHLCLAKKINFSRITIYCFWKLAHKSFTNGDSESYQSLSQKYKSGRGKKYSPTDTTTIITAIKLIPHHQQQTYCALRKQLGRLLVTITFFCYIDSNEIKVIQPHTNARIKPSLKPHNALNHVFMLSIVCN